MKELGRGGTSYNYSATFNSFFRFRGGEDLIFDNLTSELMEEYEAFLKSEKISMNSSSFYMRILRAVYNKAVDKGITEQQHPFKRVYTGIEKTMKRALPLKEIKRIKELDLGATPTMASARDLFMLSFYTRGMSFVDMVHLRKSDIKNGILSYRRRKTGQLLHIKWEACMQAIVNRYYIEDSIYLLPVMHEIVGAPNEHNRYKSKLCKVNNNLKKIAERIKLTVPLTMYVARHSWASAARAKNIPISVISEGMGHDSETTTQIYLASLDTSVVDKANSVILKALWL
ncbi:MAG: site-specific integrase [Rikenellaceae bacterium]